MQRDLQYVRNQLCKPVGVRIRYTQNARNVANDRLCRHRSERNDLRNVAVPVLASDVIDDFLPAFVTEINVEIRHRDTLRIQKALKQQIILQRIDVGDIEEVRRKRRRAASASRSDHDVVRFGVMDEVPDDQVIIDKSHPLDHGKLVFEPVAGYLAAVWHLTLHAFVTELSQILVIVHSVGRGEVRKSANAELDLDVAFLGDLVGSIQRIRVVWKHLEHFIVGLDVKLLSLHPHPIGLVYKALGLNAQEHILRVRVVLIDIMNIVCSNRCNAEIFRKLSKLWKHFLLFGDSVVLQFDVEVVSEHAQKT